MPNNTRTVDWSVVQLSQHTLLGTQSYLTKVAEAEFLWEPRNHNRISIPRQDTEDH